MYASPWVSWKPISTGSAGLYKERRNEMEQKNAAFEELSIEEMNAAAGGQYTPGRFKKEAIAYLQSCMDENLFARIMEKSDAREKPYVAARIFLNPSEWAEYVWIEQHGSLEKYQK